MKFYFAESLDSRNHQNFKKMEKIELSYGRVLLLDANLLLSISEFNQWVKSKNFSEKDENLFLIPDKLSHTELMLSGNWMAAHSNYRDDMIQLIYHSFAPIVTKDSGARSIQFVDVNSLPVVWVISASLIDGENELDFGASYWIDQYDDSIKINGLIEWQWRIVSLYLFELYGEWNPVFAGKNILRYSLRYFFVLQLLSFLLIITY